MTEPFAVASELVRKLYAGVIETPPWEAFLHGIGRETGCKATMIMLMPPGSPVVNLISIVGGQSEVTSAYRGQLFALDPFVTSTGTGASADVIVRDASSTRRAPVSGAGRTRDRAAS